VLGIWQRVKSSIALWLVIW